MSIGAGLTLVTGPTGSGKSCAVVNWLVDIKDRPLFVMGIPDLAIEHHVCPPVSEWTELRESPEDPTLKLPYFTFPPNSIVILDEAQRVYRPRPANARVPPEVAAFETRRHTGVDFVLITQNPGLLDSHIRKLVTRHIHIHDTFMGRYMLEWVGLGDIDSKASRALATRTKYQPPKRAFNLYKSSELHTKIVRKRPWYFYLFFALIPVILGLGWNIYTRFNSKFQDPAPATQPDKPHMSALPVHSPDAPAAGGSAKVLTRSEYIEQYQPRIDGLMHTAPVYDAVTAPVEPPEPVGCIDSPRTGCKCYTQQGTAYDTTEQICRHIMTKGIFLAWKRTEIKERPTQLAKPEEPDGPHFHTLPAPKPTELSPYTPGGSSPGGPSTNPKYNPQLRG